MKRWMQLLLTPVLALGVLTGCTRQYTVHPTGKLPQRDSSSPAHAYPRSHAGGHLAQDGCRCHRRGDCSGGQA